MSTSQNLNGTAYLLPSQGDVDWGPWVSAFLTALAGAVSSVLQFGALSFSGAAVNFLVPGGSVSGVGTVEYSIRVPKTGRLSSLYVRSAVAPVGAVNTYTVRVNGADTGLTCSQAIGAQNASDTTHSVAVNAGDLVSIKADSSGSTPAVGAFATLAFTAA